MQNADAGIRLGEVQTHASKVRCLRQHSVQHPLVLHNLVVAGKLLICELADVCAAVSAEYLAQALAGQDSR